MSTIQTTCAQHLNGTVNGAATIISVINLLVLLMRTGKEHSQYATGKLTYGRQNSSTACKKDEKYFTLILNNFYLSECPEISK